MKTTNVSTTSADTDFVFLHKETLTANEAALYLGVKKSYLYKLTYRRAIPFTKPSGKMVYFKRRDLDAYMNTNRITPMAEIEANATNAVKNLNI